MGKWKKKLRKFAKKAAPLAMLGLGAAALAKRRKAKALNAITDYDVSGGGTGSLSGKIGYEGDFSSAPRVPDHPSNIQSIEGGGSAPMNWKRHANKLFGTNFKKGGRVKGAGCAKRGFGRALKKK